MTDYHILHGFRDHAGRQLTGADTLFYIGPGVLFGMHAFRVESPGKPDWNTEIGSFDLKAFCVPYFVRSPGAIAAVVPIRHAIRCECGSDSVGSHNHSEYCPKGPGQPDA